ncbi:MAG: sugar phosphate isomerase/epimerase [Planctomycetaceae bacterium]|nr:sugar phosphate isomerase/epimerase [Planctomycetaceae bacterium]
MQLGFCSAILPEQSLSQVLLFAADAGYDCVELMCWPPSKADRRYAGITHIDVTEFNEEKAAQVNELATESGVAISGLGYYPNALTPNQEEADLAVSHLRKVIKASSLLGVGIVNTFVGRDWTKSVDENWPRFLETWRPLIEYAEEMNVKVGIENCPMIFTRDEWPGGKNLGSSPALWRRMFEDIPSSHFGLNYDPSHMIWQHMDYLRPMREFADRIFHVHAKDVRIDQDQLDQHGVMAYPNLWHSPKLPGLGDVNWGKFFSVLTDIGYRGPVCVEVEDRAYEATLTSREAALWQSATYLRNYIPAAFSE